MNQQELIELLEEAQQHLFDALDCLNVYVDETDDQNAKAYLVDHLQIMSASGHGFLSRDLNIDELIERVRNGDE